MELAHIHAAGVAAFTITIDRKAFVAALSLAKRVTERRNTIPILSNIVLHVGEPDMLTMTATDLDVQTRHELPCSAPVSGALTLNCQTLDSTIRKMKGDTIRLQDMGANTVALTDLQTGSTVRLPSLPASDFPVIAYGTMAAEFELDAARLAEIVATVRTAVSTEETRYYLNGIYIHPYCENPRERSEESEALAAEREELREIVRGIVAEEAAEHPAANDEAGQPDAATLEKRAAIRERVTAREAEIKERLDALEAARCAPDALRFAATDGHRLIVHSEALPAGADVMPRGILPRKACGLIAHIVPKKGATEAHCAFSESKFSIRVGRVTMTGKLIDGTFPDYTRVIPTQNEGRLSIADASAFRAAVETVAAVCTERTRALLVSMTGSFVTLYAHSPEFGKAALVYTGVSYEGDDLPLGMNARYLLDALEPFGAEPVTLQTACAASPFRFDSEALPGLTSVMMPMRVDGTIFSPDDVKRLHMNPVETLKTRAPEIMAAIERALAIEPSDETAAALRATVPGFIREQRAKLGAMAAEASAYLRSGSTDKLTARWQVKSILANAAGDERARRITGEFLAHLHGGRPAPTPPTAPEPVRQPDPAPVQPVRAPEPVELPKPAPQCADVPAVAEIEPQAPQDEPQTAIEPVPAAEPQAPAAPINEGSNDGSAGETERAPVKVADVYGRVYFVDAGDYESDRPFCRRLHKNGAPFTDSEARGGAWQRILRENIARRILARGSTDRPAKILPPAPVVDSAIADRLAALEAIVARLAAGQPALETASESVASEAPAGESEELAALRTRLAELEAERGQPSDVVRADVAERAGRMGVAQADDETFDEFVIRLGSVEAGGREIAASRASEARCAQQDAALARARVQELETALSEAKEALAAEGERARAAELHYDEASTLAQRLKVRCDALEAHAAASAILDRGAPANGHAVLPAPAVQPVQ